MLAAYFGGPDMPVPPADASWCADDMPPGISDAPDATGSFIEFFPAQPVPFALDEAPLVDAPDSTDDDSGTPDWFVSLDDFASEPGVDGTGIAALPVVAPDCERCAGELPPAVTLAPLTDVESHGESDTAPHAARFTSGDSLRRFAAFASGFAQDASTGWSDWQPNGFGKRGARR